jgi:hypothetical protein
VAHFLPSPESWPPQLHIRACRCSGLTLECLWLVPLMELILDEYRGARQQELKEIHALFVQIIALLEDIYQVRPFNQQTAQSLTELFALVRF